MPSAALPLDGGLADGLAGPACVEVACDESGSEGEKLVHGSTDTFAHASVEVATPVARAVVERVRVEARSPATEVKASVVLRPQNRRVLEWLLADGGPLLGHAHVHLTDKALHLTGRMLLLLRHDARGDNLALEQTVLEEGALDDARRVHRCASRVLGAEAWLATLGDFNDVVRARSLEEAVAHVPPLARRLSELDGILPTGIGVPARPEDVRRLVARSRGALDPIVPALTDALRHWASGGRPFRVVHDVQASLTAPAVDAAVAAAVPAGVRTAAPSGTLRGFTFVDSHDDPRVQLADFLAGAVRRVASQLLAGQADRGLVELVAPYVSPRSTWLEPWPGRAGAIGEP